MHFLFFWFFMLFFPIGIEQKKKKYAETPLGRKVLF